MRQRLKQLIGIECVSIFIDVDDDYNCFPDVIITSVGWFYVSFQMKYYFSDDPEDYQIHSKTYRIKDILSIDINLSELKRRKDSRRLNNNFNQFTGSKKLVETTPEF